MNASKYANAIFSFLIQFSLSIFYHQLDERWSTKRIEKKTKNIQQNSKWFEATTENVHCPKYKEIKNWKNPEDFFIRFETKRDECNFNLTNKVKDAFDLFQMRIFRNAKQKTHQLVTNHGSLSFDRFICCCCCSFSFLILAFEMILPYLIQSKKRESPSAYFLQWNKHFYALNSVS